MLIPRVDENKFFFVCLFIVFLSRLLCREGPHRPAGTARAGGGEEDSGSLPACLAERSTDYSLMAVDVKADEVITRPAWCGRARPCDKVNPPCVRASGCFLPSLWKTTGIDSSRLSRSPTALRRTDRRSAPSSIQHNVPPLWPGSEGGIAMRGRDFWGACLDAKQAEE